MKQTRMLDNAHLAKIRQMHCLVCGKPPPNEAAHIRCGAIEYDKPACTGMQTKPSDWWTLPLCAEHHRTGPYAQHKTGDERKWWEVRGIDPFATALRLYAEFGGTGGKPKGPRKINPRKPRDKRTKIASRKTAWPKRSFGQ